MPDPDPWDFSEFADPDPRQPRLSTGSRTGSDDRPGTASAGGQQAGAPQSDPFGSAGPDPNTGPGLTAGDWTQDYGSGGESVAVEIARPPVPYLAAAAGVSLLALLLAAVLGTIPGIAIVAWVLAGPIAIGVLAYFIKTDTTERARPIYAAPGWLRPAYVAALVLCGIAVVVAAVRIALWVGRL